MTMETPIYHSPVITICIVGMFTIPKWVFYYGFTRIHGVSQLLLPTQTREIMG